MKRNIENPIGGLRITRRIGEIIDITMDGKLVQVQLVDSDRNGAGIVVNAAKDIMINRREVTMRKLRPENWGNR